MERIARKPEHVTAEMALNKIRELVSRHEVKKIISLDSLALVLGLNAADMIVLVKELEKDGHIKHHTPHTVSKRSYSMGHVSLL